VDRLEAAGKGFADAQRQGRRLGRTRIGADDGNAAARLLDGQLFGGGRQVEGDEEGVSRMVMQLPVKGSWRRRSFCHCKAPLCSRIGASGRPENYCVCFLGKSITTGYNIASIP